ASWAKARRRVMLLFPSAEADGNKQGCCRQILPFGFSQRIREALMLLGFSHILNLDGWTKVWRKEMLLCQSAKADGNKQGCSRHLLPFGFSQRIGEELMLFGLQPHS